MSKYIKAIHACRRQVAGLEDESVWRDFLDATTGRRSLREMSEAQLGRVIEELHRRGAARQPRRAGARKITGDAQVSKARALWLALYQLGEVHDPSEAAFNAWVKGRTKSRAAPDGVDSVGWLGPYEIDRIIRALRMWCERVGFDQPTAEELEAMRSWRNLAGMAPIDIGFVAKTKLIRLLWERLGQAGAFTLAGPIFASLEGWVRQRFGVAAAHFLHPQDADRAIEQLGRWLRKQRSEKR